MPNSMANAEIEGILRKMSTVDLYVTRTSRWQTLMYLLNSSYSLIASATSLIDFFTTSSDYICAIPENVSISDAIPKRSDGSYEKCLVYENFSYLSNRTIPCPMGNRHLLPADQSIISTFGLYCDKEYLKSFPQSAFFLGGAIGAVMVAAFGDRFGKKPIVLIGYWLNILCGIGCSRANSIYLLILFRFFSGFCFELFGVTSYILSVELFAAEYRGVPAIMANFIWCTGMFVLDFVAYFIRGWRNLYLAVYLPILLTIPYYWLMKESLFWLAVHKHDEKVNEILAEAYRVNSTKPEDRIFYVPNEHENHELAVGVSKHETTWKQSFRKLKQTLQPMFSSIRFLYTLLCGCAIMSLASFLYFGLTFSASSFSSNIYLHFFISAIVESPQIIFCTLGTRYFGRKPLCLFSHLSAAIVSIVFAFIPNNQRTALNVLNHISKVFAAVNGDLVWVFVPELFPTRYRQFGMGVALLCSRTVTAASPFLSDQITNFRKTTMLIIASVAILISIAILFLPETKSYTLGEISDLKGLGECFRMTLGKSQNKQCKRKVIADSDGVSVVA